MEARLPVRSEAPGVSSSAVNVCHACQRLVRAPLSSRPAGGALWAVCERCFLLEEIANLARRLGEGHPRSAWVDNQLRLIYSELRESCHIVLLGQFYDRSNQAQSDIARVEDASEGGSESESC